MGIANFDNVVKCDETLYANWAENLKYVPQNWGTSKIFEHWKINQKYLF